MWARVRAGTTSNTDGIERLADAGAHRRTGGADGTVQFS
jgi:hypothetical protein